MTNKELQEILTLYPDDVKVRGIRESINFGYYITDNIEVDYNEDDESVYIRLG